MKFSYEALGPDSKYPDLVAGWQLRLVEALAHTRAHGTFGDNSPFAQALVDIGIELPARFRRVDWLAALRAGKPSRYTGDFYRHGLPLIVNAVLKYLEGDEAFDERVFAAADSAVEAVRRLRSEKRTATKSSGTAEPPSNSNLPGKTSLSAHVDNALSLLEGAAASHNLTGYQRTRLLAMAGRLQAPSVATRQRGYTLVTHRPTGTGEGHAGGHETPANNADPLDATRQWAAAFRDNGQFGSHASFDAMDDESSP